MITGLLVALHWIVVLAISVKIIFRRMPVGSALAWIIIIAVVPVGGVIIYFMIGDHRMGRKRLKRGDSVRNHYQTHLNIEAGAVEGGHPQINERFKSISDVAAAETGFHVRPHNKVKLIPDPQSIFDSLISDINACTEICHMEFYIIHPEGRVVSVLEAVEAAARRGVDCKIIADHIGSQPFFKSDWPARLRQRGVIVIDSLPTGVLKSLFNRSDLRNHRKIVVIDRLISYSGSFNLADPDHFKTGKGWGKWVDLMVRMEGHISEGLSVIFNTDYALETTKRNGFDIIPPLPRLESDETVPQGNVLMQAIPSGPEMQVSVIYETLVSSIYSALESITITTPYLVPDESLLLALTNAARRGVDVKIILPKTVDSFLVRHASRSYYGEMLLAGIKLYEYRDGLLHTKSILIDGELAYLGTVNLDIRSFYLNLEITLAVFDKTVCSELKTLHDTYLTASEHIEPEGWKDGNRSKPQLFLENIVRLASPLL